jgi:hypothetical protein
VAGDPFGLFEVERKISATSRLVVYPATMPIPDFALPAGLLPGGDAVRRRTHYITTNASNANTCPATASTGSTGGAQPGATG